MLPTLIFLEDHRDPATPQTLTRLALVFKKIGYKAYYSETPEGSNLERDIKFYEHRVATQKEYLRLIDEYNSHPEFGLQLSINMLDLPKDDKLNQFVNLTLFYYASGNAKSYLKNCKLFRKNEIYHDLIIQNMLVIAENLGRYKSTPHELAMLRVIKDEGFQYRAMDLNYRMGHKLDNIIDRTASGERDEKIANNFIHHTMPGFAVHGIYHGSKIEHALAQILGSEATACRYVFINLHTVNNNPEEHPLFPVVWPKNLVKINCNDKSYEEIEAQIAAIIAEKQAQHAKLLPTLREEACAELSALRKTLTDTISAHNRLSLWSACHLATYRKEISSIDKMMECFKTETPEVIFPIFTKQELKALRDKNIAFMILKYQHQGLLQSELVQVNENRMLTVNPEKLHEIEAMENNHGMAIGAKNT